MTDAKRKAAGQKLLDAAHEFWNACHEEGQYGAIQWMCGTNGELVIFTRGEYRASLLGNISARFGEGTFHEFDKDKDAP